LRASNFDINFSYVTFFTLMKRAEKMKKIVWLL